MDPIDLGCRYDKRRAAVPQDLERFDGLRLESLGDIHDKDCHIGERPAPGPQRGERVMARRIDKKKAGNTDGHLPHRAAHALYCLDGDNGRTDMLGDCPDFRTDDRRPADPVQQGCFPVVHMPHDTDNRRPDLRVLRHTLPPRCSCSGTGLFE